MSFPNKYEWTMYQWASTLTVLYGENRGMMYSTNTYKEQIFWILNKDWTHIDRSPLLKPFENVKNWDATTSTVEAANAIKTFLYEYEKYLFTLTNPPRF